MQRNIRELKQKSANRIAGKEAQARLRVLQPDLADSFRKAMAALEDATRDIAELRRRAGRLGRR